MVTEMDVFGQVGLTFQVMFVTETIHVKLLDLIYYFKSIYTSLIFTSHAISEAIKYSLFSSFYLRLSLR